MSSQPHQREADHMCGTVAEDFIEHMYNGFSLFRRSEWDWEEVATYDDPIVVRKSDGARFQIDIQVFINALPPLPAPDEEKSEPVPVDPNQLGLFNAES